MYVTSEGVKETNPRQAQYLDHWDKPVGPTNVSPRRMSSISKLVHRANSTMALLLIVAVVISTGLAFAVRSKADAHAPSSIYGFGKAADLGSPDVQPNDEVVAMASSKKASGYWIVTKHGRVQSFGDVQDLGEIGDDVIASFSDIASTPSGKGYWLLADNGNVYTFGDSEYFEAPETQGVIGHKYVKILPTKSGKGYTLVENNGDVMTFGDATVFGTAKGQLNGDKIIDARNTPSGKGYVMLSAKGAVFAFGDATFFGGVSAGQLTDAASAIAFSQGAKGYWILTQNGTILPFGEAESFGNAAETSRTGAPSIDMALHKSGDGYWVANGRIQPAPPIKVARKVISVARAQTASVGTNADANAANPDIWQALRNCEAGGVYTRNSGNGYYGAYQFSASTWRSMNTGFERADLAPPEVQDDAARRLQARSGWGQWPACSRKIGAR